MTSTSLEELKRMWEKVESAKYQELKNDRQKLAEANQGLLHELKDVTRRLEDTKALSDMRGKELIGAQAFLAKADSLSVFDVVQTVDALNEEIFQASSSLSETIVRKEYDLTDEQLGQCLEGVSHLIGEPLANIVMREAQNPDEEPVNPLLVQVVLQVFLTHFCVDKICAWTPNDATIDNFLKGIYTLMRDNEEQAVPGRWRALTRKHLVTDPAPWAPQLVQQLSLVFQHSGWDASSNHRESFENQLVPIFKGVQEARSALGEMFTSADLEATVVRPGVPFEKDCMEEVYGDGEHHKNGAETVVATTGIGVRKAVPRKRRYENVMSPKVILESSLKVALEPQPRRTSRMSKHEKGPKDERPGGKGGQEMKYLKSETSAPEAVAHSASSSQVGQEIQRIPCPDCQILEDKLDALEQRFKDAQDRFSQQRAATRVLLTETHTLPYTDLLDKVETFNKEIAGVAAFLMKNIVQRSQEAFQEELDEACEEIKPMIGGYLSDLLISQSRNAGVSFTTPPPLFVRIVVQMFLVAFCVSEISPRSSVTNVAVGAGEILFSRENHQLQPSNVPSTSSSFKSKLLGKLSTVLKVAAWVMPGSATRAEFVSRLKPLFEAREDLRVALSETFASANIELATVDHGVLFSEEFMQDAYPGSAGGSVVGTVAIGLKKSIEHEQRGSILRNIIPARVVLQSSLELTLVDQMESHQEEGRTPPELSSSGRDGRDVK